MHETLAKLAAYVRNGQRFLTENPSRWRQGSYADDSGNVCAVGAMVMGSGGNKDEGLLGLNPEWYIQDYDPNGYLLMSRTPDEVVNEVLFQNYDDGLIGGEDCIESWNDHVAGNVNDVIATLDAIATYFEHWAEWQAEVEGLTPMTPIIPMERALVLVKGDA